ncbi:hypothetical protein SDD30_15165 [Moorella naiadis]|uniref:hypothetical protein n=1 Tax=Moorella naiadis (nom. illeg.) TaxID=3093670 RepID=UPI003D9CAA8D
MEPTIKPDKNLEKLMADGYQEYAEENKRDAEEAIYAQSEVIRNREDYLEIMGWLKISERTLSDWDNEEDAGYDNY